MRFLAKAPSEKARNRFVRSTFGSGFCPDERFAECTENPSKTQGPERNGFHLSINNNVSGRFGIGFDQIVQQPQFRQNFKRVMGRKQGARSPFHQMSLDLLRSDYPTGPIAALKDQNFVAHLLKTISTGEARNSGTNDDYIRSGLHGRSLCRPSCNAPSAMSASARMKVGSLLRAGTRRKLVIPASAAVFLYRMSSS